MKKQLVSAFVAAVGFVLLSGRAFAADPAVARVLIVEAPDLSAYLKEVAVINNLQKKNGITTTIRVWRAKYAGPNSGSIVVAVEYPNLAMLAKADAATRSNAEIAAEVKKIGGLRKIISDSVYEEQSY
jgi:hypothetical protein